MSFDLIAMWIGTDLIQTEPAKTRLAYSTIQAPWADRCKCLPCKNFQLQRRSAFPASFVQLLIELGIDPSKESEVYGCYPLQSGLRQYGGWFFFCGTLTSAGQTETTQDGVMYSVRGPGDMPAPDKVFEPNPLALEFTIELPWVLHDEDPDELYGPAPKR